MSKLFERQLEELHLQMIDMGQLCEKAISLCVRSLRSQEAVSYTHLTLPTRVAV